MHPPSLRHTAILSCLILLLLSPFPAWSFDIDWKKGKWGDLAKYIGRDDYESVLNDKRVHIQIKNLLNELEIRHLSKNLKVRAGIGFDEDCLVLMGNAPHQGGQEDALVYVCLYKGTVRIALLSDEKITVYARDIRGYEDLSNSMRSWIYVQKNHQVLKQPPFVTLVHTKSPE